jgi:hypothetical protein
LERESSAAGASLHLHFDLGFDGLANLKLAIGDMYNDVGYCFGFSEFIFESLVICDVQALGKNYK